MRGELTIHADQPRTVLLYMDNVLESSIDGKRYFGGDFYAYRRAPLVLHLNPGPHTLDVRLVRDVRAMGGIGAPLVSLGLRAEFSSGGLAVVEEKILLPEMIGGKLVNNVGSVPVRNEGQEWIDILGVESVDEVFISVNPLSKIAYTPKHALQLMLRRSPWRLAPGQSSPLSFKITSLSAMSKKVVFRIIYRTSASPHVLHTPSFSFAITARTFDEPHRMTFLHPSGVVSYAILRCPSLTSPKSSPTETLPVLLNLHGAGLEADSDQVRHMLDPVTDIRAWTLFPTGGSSWSGDDW
ncbi:hypothetical protein MMC30_001504, partial [Trapelia coarctata]|nr:hypothetical protein [Trapelia coarctata]